MSDGPLGPGQCTENAVKGVTDLLFSPSELFNTNQFINPQLVNIVNMRTSRTDAFARSEIYRDYLETLFPAPPDLAAKLQQVDDLQAAMEGFDDAVNQYEIWTNYCSGKSNVFPMGDLDMGLLFPGGGPPGFSVGLPMLAGIGFAGMLGLVKGGNQSAYTQCQVDPEDPCAGVKTVLGAVMGAFNTVINTIIAGYNAMIDFAADIVSYIAQALAYVEQIVGIVANAVAKLADTVLKAVLDGMSKLLRSLNLDPCLGVVLGNIMSPTLAEAVALP